jgi:hypothetical protein
MHLDYCSAHSFNVFSDDNTDQFRLSVTCFVGRRVISKFCSWGWDRGQDRILFLTELLKEKKPSKRTIIANWMLITHEAPGLEPALRDLTNCLIATQQIVREAFMSVTNPDLLQLRAAQIVSPAVHAIGLAGIAVPQRGSELLFLVFYLLALLVVLVVLAVRFHGTVAPRRFSVAGVLVACAAVWLQLTGPHQTRCVAPYSLEAGMCVPPPGTMLDAASQLVCLPGHTREVYTDVSGVAATRCNICPLPRVAQGDTCACVAPRVFRDFDCRCPANLELNGEGGCVCPPHFVPSPNGSTQCVRYISPQSVHAFHIKSKGELRWACFKTLDSRWDCAGNPNTGHDHGHVALDADDCISKVELVVDGKHQKINQLRLTTYKGRVFGWYGTDSGRHYVTHDGNGKCLTGVAMSAGNRWFTRVIYGFHPRW